MATLDKETIGFGLKLVSTFTSGMFAGCALYVNAVEHPARMTHDMTTAVTIWKPSYLRAIELNVRTYAVFVLIKVDPILCCRTAQLSDIAWAACLSVSGLPWRARASRNTRSLILAVQFLYDQAFCRQVSSKTF